MRLIKLLELLQFSEISSYLRENDFEITGLALDSRVVKPGNIFFAYQGAQLDGRHYIQDAIEKGASAIFIDGDSQSSHSHESRETSSAPITINISNLPKKTGQIAAVFYDHPSQKMRVIGITGTNGKTSCSHFIAAALDQLNIPCGVMGTLGNGLYGKIQASNLTTPDPITVQKTLANFLHQGAHFTSMEVSSHSLDQGRVSGIHFAVGIFTNLTRDHLDYHGTMENYAAAKKKLFENGMSQYAVLNADDEFGKKIINDLGNNKYVFSYGTDKSALVYASNIHLDLKGIHAHIHSPWGEGELVAGLIGRFNLSNILAVLTTLCLLDIPFNTVLQVISKLKSVDGRMQTLGGQQKPLVVVDYSHTPDAIEKVLTALRSHCHGKLYCVFGCGGDRDRGKRPMMAKIAEQFSDVVMVTDDNPRTEDSEQIFEDIKAGFTHPEKIVFEHDRATAIRNAIHTAKEGDCILIAGKGAETYQIIGIEKHPFSDVEQVELNL